MRPDVLFSLFVPLTTLPGVGPKIGDALSALAGPNIVDLLWHLPTGLLDRRQVSSIADAPHGSLVTLTVNIGEHKPSPARRGPYRVRCSDKTGHLDLVFFNARREYLLQRFPPSSQRVISGVIEYFNGSLQITHPDRIGKPDELAAIAVVEAVYPMAAGVNGKTVNRAIKAALERASELPEWLTLEYRDSQKWMSWKDALTHLHCPSTTTDTEVMAPARQRLAYDELLANQLALGLTRAHTRDGNGRPLIGDDKLYKEGIAGLPYKLTPSQQVSLEEIIDDLRRPSRMLRLLQGDVGSGKTVVAFIAMLVAIESGVQACLMAPTEILARQHFKTLENFVSDMGVTITLITGRDTGTERDSVRADVGSGASQIIVGTHALFQEGVEFADLGLIVIDEQHRFGVHQRLALSAKGNAPDTLVMTATPIPRTLTMTFYGDMDISRLTEKPAGRNPVTTRAIPSNRLEEVISAVGREIKRGGKAYWVCPLIGESEDLDLAAAEKRHEDLVAYFGDRVALLHGRMSNAEKDEVMISFLRGHTCIMVSTTVIEVGVDVPEATVMVVEHAERFGLAQLHQLRGRVGRGKRQSTCLLVYTTPLAPTPLARLNILRKTDDGFRIADEDLRLRGAGEVLGTRQSGLPNFRLADINAHEGLLIAARKDAQQVVSENPSLTGPRGLALRVLLYLFERDSAVRLLSSG